MSALNRISTFLFYDGTTTPEFFKQVADDAAISNQYVQWVSEKTSQICTAIVSAMGEKVSHRTAPDKSSTVLTSKNAALVEFATEQIRQEKSTLAHGDEQSETVP